MLNCLNAVLFASVMSNKNKCKWENFKKRHAEKRRKKDENLHDAVDYLTVQRLTADVEGKCQKYGRIGPLTIVPFPYDALTLDNIKTACKNHFGIASVMECDVLAGERGPSYTSIDQIKNTKLLHVRFHFNDQAAENHDEGHDEEDPLLLSSSYRLTSGTAAKKARIEKAGKPRVSNFAETRRSLNIDSPKKEATTSSFPKSVPLSTILQLGKMIPPKCDEEIVELYLEEFSIDKKEWLLPFPVKLSISKTSFASGAFRNAFEAKGISGLKGRYVVKRYKPDEMKAIEEVFGSVDNHTRKSVQMHTLAKYYASAMEKEVSTCKEFGETFKYTKVYLGRSCDGQLVTVEPYMEGEFVKYINNDGEIIVKGSEISAKAEAFAHFTYVKSQNTIMVLDIQGTKYSLYDPEIASAKLLDDTTKAVLFCYGNLSTIAIERFLLDHKCNKYCTLLGICVL